MAREEKWLNILELSDAFGGSGGDKGETAGTGDRFRFLLERDTEGVVRLRLTDEGGKEISPDPLAYGGEERRLLLLWHKIGGKNRNTFSWGGQEKRRPRWDEHPDFTELLLDSGTPLFCGSPERELKRSDGQPGRLVLSLREEEGKSLTASLLFHREGRDYPDPEVISSRDVLAEDTLFTCRPAAGPEYGGIARFAGKIRPDEAETVLTLFASHYPGAEIRLEDYDFVRTGEVTAETGLRFTALDEEGNLHLSLLRSLPGLPEEFVNNARPGQLVRLNRRERRIETAQILYGSDTGETMPAYLKKQVRKTLSRPGEDSFYLPADRALDFLTGNLGKLARDYALFGTEALEKYRLKTIRPVPQIRMSRGIDYFEGQCDLELGTDIIPLDRALKLFEENNYIPLSDGTRAIVDKRFFDNLIRVLGKISGKNRFKASLFDLPLIDQLIDGCIEGEEFTANRQLFQGFNGISSKKLRKDLIEGELRDYQKYGVKWLTYLKENRLGGCLADDMGLGKTIQTVTLLAAEYRNGKKKPPSLIVMPRSLLSNWQGELKKFTPFLSVCLYHGTDRNLEEARKHQIILTTYALVRNDLDQLGQIDFNFLILDEIQAIKNLNSRIAKAVMLLKGEYRFGLSGTPMENHVGEIYAVFRFLNPAMFGTFADFSRRYMTPIQKHNDSRAADMLARKLSPFLLRRLKQDVASELPERTEQVLYADMEEAQAALYEERREFYRQAVLSSVKTEGFGKSGFLILQGLMELRQLASVPETHTDGEVISAKWQVFLNHLTEVIEGGHRCLVFTNFLATVELLSRKLDQLGVEHLVMTGSTDNRAKLVEKFQESRRYKAFIMTLKTGGVGLNLTGADYVYLLDPWWNRSAEQQAIDRTHRIGQTRNIFSYRIIARGTIEEKMLELQEQKKELFDALISSEGQLMKQLTEEDIDYLLAGGTDA